MENLQILVLEDNLEEAHELTLLLETNEYSVTHVINIHEANIEVKKQVYDMIILDIMIDGKPEGITFAQQLDADEIRIPFLFLTSIQSRAIFDKAKYTKPFSYILKPFNEMELLYAIELAIETYHGQENTISGATTNAVIGPEFLFVKKQQKVVKVNVNTINYIEVSEKYCSLICDEGSYFIKLSLSKIKDVLANPDFKQTHRNYLVNVKKIKELYVEDNLIILEANYKVPFSARYKAAFLKEGLFFR
ncbi:DNA-binding response regulator [Kordia sp. YSTF-M3]|uniref:DNA-binding response regulator n=1 Tax=Kordia aestuariivivens TaxID=2759037 RepID=A0ABR7Q893_9FLAO|nr:LytTR family transcriptional regulator DNA-binding domain-containing protein [Kordia aestuariivivens]MBC8754658.1 DNA-binding response regulator [Kordia aestuariivivens]